MLNILATVDYTVDAGDDFVEAARQDQEQHGRLMERLRGVQRGAGWAGVGASDDAGAHRLQPRSRAFLHVHGHVLANHSAGGECSD